MTVSPIAQLFEQALVQVITICAPILSNAGSMPPLDETGAPMHVPMTADYQAGTLTAPLVHVAIEDGTLDLAGMDEGRLAYDPASGAYPHLMTSYDSKLTFTIYTAVEPQRRYLADYLRWNIVTAYAISDGTSDVPGTRIDSYLIEQLKGVGIFPHTQRRFDKVEYPPEDTRAARPFGQPWRAVVRLNCDIAIVWSTPAVVLGTTDLNLTGQDPDGATFILPATI